MSCERYQSEILESFGLHIISAELKTHIESCEECRTMYNDLHALSTQVGSDDLFFDSEEEIEKRVEAVNQKIDSIELKKITSPARWKSYVPMAAALFLVLAVGMISKNMLKFQNNLQTADSLKTEQIVVSLDDSDKQTLKGIDISDFVEQYSTEYTLDNEMTLMDDISDAEYEYLEENLNIGEIL